ncbi:MAG: ATP-binding cassette domain-containing protein [Flavonifractor plautii]
MGRGRCCGGGPAGGAGELVFVLGANGAGKTTLFRRILGLLPGYQGCVRVDGQRRVIPGAPRPGQKSPIFPRPAI